jgi:hypothetical protein
MQLRDPSAVPTSKYDGDSILSTPVQHVMTNPPLNGLTAIDAREHQLFNELHGSIVF